jgi:aryl-alcohol dehydrogenase-like predicted oxidoreductase
LWTLEQPGITITLVGARNKEQAAENAWAVDTTLTKEEIEIISDHLNQVELA